MTSTPYLGLPVLLLSILSSKAFVFGHPVLAHALNDISEWPDPRRQSVNSSAYLPFLDDLIAVNWSAAFLTSFSAPNAHIYSPPTQSLDESHSSTSLARDHAVWDVSNSTHAGATRPSLTRVWTLCTPLLNRNAPIFHEINPVVALNGILEFIPALWEILVLGEPLLVYASTPTACSAAVMAILGLIHPLPFIGDWRPYFCIQDPDYERILAARNVYDLFPEGAVYGISNRHLVDTMKFPHVLYLPSPRHDVKVLKARMVSPFRPCLQRSRTVRQAAFRALYVHIRQGDVEVSEAVRNFRSSVFERITRPFLRIFDKYLQPTWGDGRQISDERYVMDPFGRGLQLKSLNMDVFPTLDDLSSPRLTTLFKRGPSWKSRVKTLYHRFVQGPVFREWWHKARMTAEEECIKVHRKHMLEACARGCSIIRMTLLAGQANKRQMIEAISDVAVRVRKELDCTNCDDKVLRDSLRKELKSLSEALPRCDGEKLRNQLIECPEEKEVN